MRRRSSIPLGILLRRNTPRGGDQNEKDEVSPQEQEMIDKAQHIVWIRRDPKRPFTEGTRSEHHTNFDKDSFHSTIADYLSRPYLRHPVLDWIFMEMTISQELSAFGESLN